MKDINKLAEEYQRENDYLVERIQSELIPGQIRTLIREIWKDGYTAAKEDKGGGMKWISVEDRLPIQDKKVIWRMDDGQVFNGYMDEEAGKWWVYIQNEKGDSESFSPYDFKEWLDPSPSHSSPVATQVDWDAIEKDFLDYGIHSNVGDDDKIKIVNWFRSRPEFQLRQNSETEEFGRKCYEDGKHNFGKTWDEYKLSPEFKARPESK